jgi:hypothetical protein
MTLITIIAVMGIITAIAALLQVVNFAVNAFEDTIGNFDKVFGILLWVKILALAAIWVCFIIWLIRLVL